MDYDKAKEEAIIFGLELDFCSPEEARLRIFDKLAEIRTRREQRETD